MGICQLGSPRKDVLNSVGVSVALEGAGTCSGEYDNENCMAHKTSIGDFQWKLCLQSIEVGH